MKSVKFFVLLAAVLLTGCGTTQPIVQTQYVAIFPEDHLLVDCEQALPPDIKQYIALKEWSDKEKVLIDKLKETNANINECNIRLRNLRLWKQEQQSNIDKKNQEAKKD